MRTPPRPNRDPFVVRTTEGRLQPYTVWRGGQIWFFSDSIQAAADFIDQQEKFERVPRL